MNDLETRLRETLRERSAETERRTMPPGTVRRLRRRQARFAVGVATVTAIAVVAAVGVFRMLPRGPAGPGPAGASLAAPSHPIEQVPEGWPPVDVGPPEDAPYVMAADVADAIGAVTVVASGTAGDARFSYMAWTGGRDEDGVAGPCIGFAGPWEGRTPPTDPALQGFGGVISATCAHWQQDPVPAAADLYLAGQRDPGSAPGIAANYGFLSERVARLELDLGGRPTWEVPILDGPPSWNGIRTFLFFPPADTEGLLVAYDGDGRALTRAEICVAVSKGSGGGCGGETEQLAPTPGPEAWPEVTSGGAFTPYVDHEVSLDGEIDPGVATPKTVIAYGTVQDVPWSLTAFLTNGKGDWSGNEGPCGQLFLGPEGEYGGGGFCLNNTTPPETTDFSMTGFGFGSGPITAYAGIVTDRVARVEFVTTGGATRDVELIPGPDGVDARYFILFTPGGASGRAVAYSLDGQVVATADLCLEFPIDPGSTVSCG